jgi:acetyltransferase
VSEDEATGIIRSLRSYPLIRGVRGREGVNEELFRNVIMRLSALLEVVPEIEELDLNPLLGTPGEVVAVDARIRILPGL